jgi:hypothetical protein
MGRAERRKRNRSEALLDVTTVEVEATMTDALRQAGAHPAHIYAFQQTGFLLTTENEDKFSAEDLQAWDDAMARYLKVHPETE